MKYQRGLSLVSTLIVSALMLTVLILGFKCVPVYAEYFAVKKAFTKVIQATDATASPTEFRKAFQRFADIDDINSVDTQSIDIRKENGKASLHTEYSRRVKLYGPVSLIFDFVVDSD